MVLRGGAFGGDKAIRPLPLWLESVPLQEETEMISLSAM